MDLIKPKRVKLSKRMNLFLDYSIDSLPFWDLCCDHGLVGLGSLVFRKNSSHVYFVDQVPHIMTLLQKKLINFILNRKLLILFIACQLKS